GSSHAGCGMVLHGGHIDDLCDLVRHNACHVGTGFPLAEEVGITIKIRLIADHAAGESVLDTDNAHSGRQQCLITAEINFVRVSVIYNDIPRRHSHRTDGGDDLADDLG